VYGGVLDAAQPPERRVPAVFPVPADLPSAARADRGRGLRNRGFPAVSAPTRSASTSNAHTVAYCNGGRGLDARLMEPDVLPFEGRQLRFGADGQRARAHRRGRPALLREAAPRAAGRRSGADWGFRESNWVGTAISDHKVRYDEASLSATLGSCDFCHRSRFFHTPLWQSAWLSRRLRQYCVFRAVPEAATSSSRAQPIYAG